MVVRVQPQFVLTYFTYSPFGEILIEKDIWNKKWIDTLKYGIKWIDMPKINRSVRVTQISLSALLRLITLFITNSKAIQTW